MAAVHDVQGYAIALDKVAFITRIFDTNGEGVQFNVVLVGGGRLSLKFPDRTTGTVARESLVAALREA